MALLVALMGALAPAAQATTPQGKAGLIAVQSDGGIAQPDIWTFKTDGTEPLNLTNTADPANEDVPAFGGDADTIFFRRDVAASYGLWSMSTDGSGQTELLTLSGTDQIFGLTPAPDGASIAFIRMPAGAATTDVWLRAADGVLSNLSNTPSNVYEDGPDFSPDGRSIVYAYCVGMDPCDIWAMNADGSGQRPLTTTGVHEQMPVYSRDSQKIAFLRNEAGLGNIWVMNADGSGAVSLTGTPGETASDFNPAFSADGKSVFFERCAPECDIYSIPVIGGAETAITAGINFNVHDPSAQSIQRCGKKEATIVGDDGPDKIKGTKRKDVIDANAGKNKVRARGGNDVICAGKKATIVCGGGNDRVIGKFKKAKGCERGKGLD